MKPTLAEQLRGIKLDYQEYGRLPIHEDVLVFGVKKNEDGKIVSDRELLRQWKKLNLLRKNLKILNSYIQQNKDNKGETLNGWVARTGNRGISHLILKQIGDHTNETGGISAFFLNLQNFYDLQEEKYDALEMASQVSGDMEKSVLAMRDARQAKRRTRKKARKLKFKEMNTDGKGYLLIAAEEPTIEAPEAKKEPQGKSEPDKKDGGGESPKNDAADKAMKKVKRNMQILVAGTIITVAVVATVAALTKK